MIQFLKELWSLTVSTVCWDFSVQPETFSQTTPKHFPELTFPPFHIRKELWGNPHRVVRWELVCLMLCDTCASWNSQESSGSSCTSRLAQHECPLWWVQKKHSDHQGCLLLTICCKEGGNARKQQLLWVATKAFQKQNGWNVCDFSLFKQNSLFESQT